MKQTIKNLIALAENTNDTDMQYAILEEVKYLISQFAMTINCPSNWRSIGEELVEEYKDNIFIYETLHLWDYTEN